MSLCRVGTTLRLSRLMAAEPQLAEPAWSNRLRRRSSWESDPAAVRDTWLRTTYWSSTSRPTSWTTTSGLWTTRDGASTATSPTSRPSAGDANDATESTPARDAADAANDARDGTRTTSVPNDAGSAADDDAHAGAQSTANDESPDDAGIYDIQPRMVECAGYDGVCSLNWLMDIASC